MSFSVCSLSDVFYFFFSDRRSFKYIHFWGTLQVLAFIPPVKHMKEPCKLSVLKTLLVFCVSGCNSKRNRELESGQCDPVFNWRIQLNIEVQMKRVGEGNPWPSALTASQVLHLWVCRGRETDRCNIDKHLNSVTLEIEKNIYFMSASAQSL